MIRGGCALDAGAIEFLFRISEHAVKQEADSEPEDVLVPSNCNSMHTILNCQPGGDFRKSLTELGLAEISAAAGMERQVLC
jgi:hypothetical protein